MMRQIRLPAVAGSFYPSAPDALRAELESCFVSDPLGPAGHVSPMSRLIAGMLPHAGYAYSGPCAAQFYARVPPRIERVFIVGVNHWSRGHRAALSPAAFWRTPLGDVAVDQDCNRMLERRVRFLKPDAAAHAEEHSIEVQLPFLQRVLANFRFVPIALARVSAAECAELGAAIAELCSAAGAPLSLVLASSDLSHYLSPEKTDELDHAALAPILKADPVGLLNVVKKEEITMCGVRPAAVMLYAINRLHSQPPRLLKHYHSGNVKPMANVVGYASVAVER